MAYNTAIYYPIRPGGLRSHTWSCLADKQVLLPTLKTTRMNTRWHIVPVNLKFPSKIYRRLMSQINTKKKFIMEYPFLVFQSFFVKEKDSNPG